MKFRTRLLIAFGVVVLIPLLVFGLGIRREMSKRVTSEYVQRVNTLVGVINADIGREDDRSRARLAALKSALINDNNFRNVLVRGADRTYVLDYAGDAMRLAGLLFLRILQAERPGPSPLAFRNDTIGLGPALPCRPPLHRAAPRRAALAPRLPRPTR